MFLHCTLADSQLRSHLAILLALQIMGFKYFARAWRKPAHHPPDSLNLLVVVRPFGRYGFVGGIGEIFGITLMYGLLSEEIRTSVAYNRKKIIGSFRLRQVRIVGEKIFKAIGHDVSRSLIVTDKAEGITIYL